MSGCILVSKTLRGCRSGTSSRPEQRRRKAKLVYLLVGCSGGDEDDGSFGDHLLRAWRCKYIAGDAHQTRMLEHVLVGSWQVWFIIFKYLNLLHMDSILTSAQNSADIIANSFTTEW